MRVTTAFKRLLRLEGVNVTAVEFLAQSLQLIRGGRESALQQPRLLHALAALRQAGQVSADTAACLAEDYRFVRAVFEALHRDDRAPFGLQEILDLLVARPEIAALNARWAGVNWYRHHLDELRTVGAADTRADVA